MEVMENSHEKKEEEIDNELAQDDFVKDKEYEMTPRNALNNSGEGDNFAKGETTALVTPKGKIRASVKRGLMAKMKSLSSSNNILKKDSMFSFEKEKTQMKLTKDATSMGYAVFLKYEFIQQNFEDD